MTSPNGGEVWQSGAIESITWTTDGICGDTVKIELAHDSNGLVCRTINNGTPNDGVYNLTAIQCWTEETGYKIRITDLATAATDSSDASYSILPLP